MLWNMKLRKNTESRSIGKQEDRLAGFQPVIGEKSKSEE